MLYPAKMFPINHFLASALVTGLVAIQQGAGTVTFFEWMFVGGLIAVVLDFDHIIYPFFRGDRRYLFWNTLKDPMSTIKDLHKFVNALIFPGLSIMHITSHMIFAVAIVFIFNCIFPSLLLPVAVSLSTHILTDIIDTILHPARW